jgi:hypothetical protein
MYLDKIKNAGNTKTNVSELIYALTYGNILSNKYNGSQIRMLWENGCLPGDRICLVAGKNENTKIGKDKRETESADDIQRECITEGE